MLKYVDTLVSFSEVPNQISLSINISGCPIHCEGCHSKYLWEDIGTPLNNDTISDLIDRNIGITCICLMGGDQSPSEVADLFLFIKKKYPTLLTCWYSGKSILSKELYNIDLDFYKLGPYISKLGGLTSNKTNQRFYSKGIHMHKMSAYGNSYYDITDKFYNNEVKDKG